MPRYPVNVTHREIPRLVRAAKEAGATEVVIDNEGQIHIVLSIDAPAVSSSPPADAGGQVWTMSVARKKKRWSSRDATSWRDIPKHLLRR